jgi:hypothetical protein
MKKAFRPIAWLLTFALGAMLPASSGAQSAAPGTSVSGTSAHMLVTVEARHGSEVPEIGRADVMVHEGHNRDEVTNWVPAQGENGALELYILLDDGSGINLGSQLEEIRKFIAAQPASTKIGLAYMQDGRAKVQQELTAEHELAAKALRLPLGVPGVNASPYFSLSDLIKHWPQSNARREVVMVSDGIDHYYDNADANDPYLSAAIDDAQRGGILVFGIYTPGAGHFGHSHWQSYWGQMYLSRAAEETGGEAYYIGFSGAPVSFNPYFEDVERHLNHQYWLTFNPQPQKKSGLQRVKVSTEVSHGELVAAHQVYVEAAPR